MLHSNSRHFRDCEEHWRHVITEDSSDEAIEELVEIKRVYYQKAWWEYTNEYPEDDWGNPEWQNS